MAEPSTQIFWEACPADAHWDCVFILIFHPLLDSLGVIGATAQISAIVGVGCGVLAWTYQTGSSRLGVVDLFSCEIITHLPSRVCCWK